MNTEGFIAWDEAVKLWDHFDKRMQEAGYRIHVINGDRYITDSTKALKDDKYVPIIRFLLFKVDRKSYSFSLEVTDRNGNSILDGKTIGYFRFSEYTLEKLNEAIDFVLETFGCYNEDNTVPTKFEEIEKTF